MKKIIIMVLFLSFPLVGNQKSPEFFKKMEEDKAVWKDLDKGLLNSILDLVGGALSVAEDVAYSLLKPVQLLIKQNQFAIENNQYKDVKAHVRCGDPICDMEFAFRKKRFEKVKKAQERLLGMKLADEDVLDIGFSCSGGGWRAMCCALGSCSGAQKMNLLDCVMCISGLSGSTWFLGPWISTGMNLQDYRDRAIKVASKGIDLRSLSDIGPIIDNLWVKFAYNQPLNIIDLYGGLLGNALLRDIEGRDPHQVYLTLQRRRIKNGDYPLPVYTATLGERRKAEFWFEFTPYEVGSRWLSAYVPTWAFGRHFKKGVSIDDAPEQSLGFGMGTFGSAFAADFEDIYDTIIDGIKFPDFLKKIPFAEKIFNSIKKVFSKLAYASDLGDLRVAWARVPNFVYKMRGMLHNKYKTLNLVDAGLDFNNPVFATYRKPPYGDAPDVVFMFDASGSLEYKELKKSVDYADYNGLKFPKMEPFELDKKIMKFFKDDEDIKVPVVIYMPRINGINMVKRNHYKSWYDYYLDLLKDFDMEKAISSGFASTFNFNYTERQAEQLIAATEFNVIAVADKIIDVLKKRVEAKRKARKG